MQCYDENNMEQLYDRLASKETDFKKIISEFGYPPVWVRPNTFETMVLTILEQQVSLASAYAAYKKLKERILITPNNLLQLSDEELRACYLSRQKIVYTRALATAIINKQVHLKSFEKQADDIIRTALK